MQRARKSGFFLHRLCFREVQRGGILLLPEQRVQFDIDRAFNASSLHNAVEFQIDSSERQVGVAEKHDLAVLHGAGRDGNLDGPGARMMQCDLSGERSAGLRQQNFSRAVPAAAVPLTGMDGRL